MSDGKFADNGFTGVPTGEGRTYLYNPDIARIAEAVEGIEYLIEQLLIKVLEEQSEDNS